ncbi:helix-turn-helix transcriptional regulator [Streptomyces turgidiscabies]|uniref:DNA-binding CsgD family transcriptional regulator n=1 Tax=Streptomyces turgidiscabies TaxID=85558 RepID=A0ABU0RUJ2_9ACTN|nr:LuxR family transcriptional regulator [Streptomyces turgidiscabies]MDQ0935652.1 DNA-binding CsgD family transcriptional regulator [Streptomyces turgidiscabies]
MGTERSTPHRSQPVMELVGRQAEIAQILDIVEEKHSESRMLLLLGEAGTGKTGLLAVALSHARDSGTLVLASQGIEAESRQSFASLHQLLLPVLPDIATLADHLRKALETAFGIAPAEGPPDPMLLRVAVLTLLSEVSDRQRVLLAVDDVQHFDRDSLDVLNFVMRRLTARDVPVLLAARGQTPPDEVPADLHTLLLGPLTEQAAAELVDAQPQAPTGRTRSELLRQAGGNPLAIIELCRAAGAGGTGALPGSGLPQTERIQELYAARLRGLPEKIRRLILYAAASQYGYLATIMAAAGAGPDLSVWAPAEKAGLVTIMEDRVVFRHPLARAGSYRAAPAYLRQQVHRDLAAVLTTDPAPRAWHLAAACVGYDESVAAALEDTAELAERRGGFYAAAQALERSAECSPATADRARRYGKALHAAAAAADPSWVSELYDKVTALTEDPDVLGMAACGAGMALSLFGHQRQGFRVLMSALEPDPPRSGMTVFALASVLGAVAYQSGLPEVGHRVAGLLDEAGARNRDTPFSELATSDSWAAVRAVTLAAVDPTDATELLRGIRRRVGAPEPTTSVAEMTRILGIGGVAWHADESDLCVETFRQAYALLSAYGAMGPAAPTLTAMAAALIDTGRWVEADEHLERTAALAAVHKLRFVQIDVEALRATLRALRGETADITADPAWTAVGLEENRATHARLLRAAGTAAATAGGFDGAFRHFRSLFAEDGTPLHYFLSPRSVADFAAAAQRTGRQEEATRILAVVRAALGPRPSTRMILLMHHATALTDDPKDAEHHFRLATVNPAGDQWPLARAQARLHYAQWLRRRRRPLDARPLLTTALESFTRLGASPLAEEASAELRASGVATSPAKADPLAELTAQQRQIVRLAARGLRNREIAEQLMLSPRTVSSHLYNVYPKLGVSSRNQLRDLFDDL